jgi:hypothetical protein
MSEPVLIAKPRVVLGAWREWVLVLRYADEDFVTPYPSRLSAMSDGRQIAMTTRYVAPSPGHRWYRDTSTTPPTLVEVPL